MIPIVILFALVLAPSDGTRGGLVWSAPTGMSPAVVALADRGGQVAALHSTYHLQLFSSFDSNPPAPLWDRAVTGLAGRVAASRASDVVLYSSARILGGEGPCRSYLQRFGSSTPAPRWSFAYSPQYWSFPWFGVSDDGGTIVSALTDEITERTEVRIHDPATGDVRSQFGVPTGWLGAFALSPDGSTIAMTGGYEPPYVTTVVDPATRSVLFQTPGSLPGRQGLSNAGRVLAVKEKASEGTSHLRAFVRETTGYRPILDEIARPDLWLEDWAVSDDGSTLVAGWFDHRSPTRAILRAFDLASGARTMERVIVADTLDNVPSDLAICADGSRFVAGLWGDAEGTIAELQVFARDRDEPLVEYAAGGTVGAVDISPDGDRFVAARAERHFEQGYQHSSLEMYEFGGEDLVLRGRPSIGSTPALEYHGTPSSPAFLLASRALAPEPLELPGMGTLYLARRATVARSVGTIPASGVARIPLAIPDLPGLVGTRAWYQGFETAPRALSRDFVQLTVLP